MESLKKLINDNEITRNNDLSEYLGLDYVETTVGSNGYPQSLNWAMTSDSIAQLLKAKESLEQEGYEVEELFLKKKDGQQLWNRSNTYIKKGQMQIASDQDYYIDLDYNTSIDELIQEVKEFWYGGDQDHLKELALDAVEDQSVESVAEFMDTIIKEAKSFIEEAGEEGVIRVFVNNNDLKHIDYTVTDDQTGYSYDSSSYQVAIRVSNFDIDN